LADAPMRSKRVTKEAQIPRACSTTLRAVIEEGFERFITLTEVRYKNLFQFSFVCLRRCH